MVDGARDSSTNLIPGEIHENEVRSEVAGNFPGEVRSHDGDGGKSIGSR